ncbi:MAG: MBL fold metallo-hydrolase [Myxococcales bacterium]
MERNDRLTVRFWGVRGSVATGGLEFAGVGGNTSCVELRAGGDILVLDGGTGLRSLGESLGPAVRVHLLLSHLHWDHIQGFPFFAPAYSPQAEVTVYGPAPDDAALRAVLARQMEPPGFPVGLDTLRARLRFRALAPGDELAVGGAGVRAIALRHPQPCLGYLVSAAGRRVLYATDTERLPEGVLDEAMVEAARGADLLIHDSQYTDEEYAGRKGPPRAGWGHSTVGDACRLAAAAGVRRLALFHHDPSHDDREMSRLGEEAKALFPNAAVAREGLTLTL